MASYFTGSVRAACGHAMRHRRRRPLVQGLSIGRRNQHPTALFV